MDETRQDEARTAGGPWHAGQPQAGQPAASRWGARPDLRVSDADRDAVMAELGEHLGQGRLDQAEFEERVTAALSARTGRDLNKLLADLPPSKQESTAPKPAMPLPRSLLLMLLLAAAILMAVVAAGGWHHGWVPWPLWWLVAIMVLRLGWWRRNWRGRRWQ